MAKISVLLWFTCTSKMSLGGFNGSNCTRQLWKGPNCTNRFLLKLGLKGSLHPSIGIPIGLLDIYHPSVKIPNYAPEPVMTFFSNKDCKITYENDVNSDIPLFWILDTPWITLKWYKSSIFFTGLLGELCEWNLNLSTKKHMDSIIKSELSSPDFNELHREHSKNLFSIGVHEDLVFTIGQKWLICVNDVTFYVLKLTEECLFLIPLGIVIR